MDKVLCNQSVLKEVSTELGLPFKDVKEIIDLQSEFTKFIIESNTFDNVRWPYLGIFKAKTKEIQLINFIKGMSPIEAEEFKKAVRTGKFKLQPESKTFTKETDESN